jgi:hypothetical protein
MGGVDSMESLPNVRAAGYTSRQDVIEQLEAEGCKRGAPADVDWQAVELDAAACRDTPCGACLCLSGLIFEPWRTADGKQYVGLAYCPWCYSAVEM